jgi:predicted phosphohydrolase
MRLAWATDIHLTFLTSIDRRRFLESINEQADALVVSGDIAESNSLGEVLRQMSDVLDMPVYFVLGNHDFYRGSVVDTRADVEEMIRNSGNLFYLSQAGVVELTPSTALVGHDGRSDDPSPDRVFHRVEVDRRQTAVPLAALERRILVVGAVEMDDGDRAIGAALLRSHRP